MSSRDSRPKSSTSAQDEDESSRAPRKLLSRRTHTKPAKKQQKTRPRKRTKRAREEETSESEEELLPIDTSERRVSARLKVKVHENTHTETIAASSSAVQQGEKQSHKVEQEEGLDSSSSSAGQLSSDDEDDDLDDADDTMEDVDEEQILQESAESLDEDSDDSSFSLDNVRAHPKKKADMSETEHSKVEMEVPDATVTEPESPMPAPSPAALPAVTASTDDAPVAVPSPLRKRRRLRPSSASAAATAASLDVADSQDEISDPEDPIAIMTSSSNPHAISPFRSPSQHVAAPPVVIGTSFGVRRVDGQKRQKKEAASVLQKLAQAQQQQQKNTRANTPVLDLTQLVSLPEIELLSKGHNHDNNPSSDEQDDDYEEEPMALDEQQHQEAPQEVVDSVANKQDDAQNIDIPAAADSAQEASIQEDDEPDSPASVSFWSMLLPYGPYLDL
ncbi:hypothetical protein BCR43DRAFT_492327 [Syncephalastrum racemosum]|uniref:Uncharacterized protein n=1 Tax=Syncephalastrum racemosum TaxID=13706 RepID=A0A1X2HDD8_SYNRA|nr:hypothetical protein BCR43DRAFT_492327 [Syncephalastrum racemosum]